MKIDGSGQRKTPRGLWIPRTPGARDEVVGGMESWEGRSRGGDEVGTRSDGTMPDLPCAATIGKSGNLRNKTGWKHKEAG